MTRQENLGDVRNRGIGVTLASRILDTKQTSWSVTLNASRNTNELTRLNTGLVKPPTIFVSQYHRVGYPLFGFWSRSATFTDADGDGYLTHDDVVATDSLVYMGSSLPTVDIGYSNDVSLFGGMVRINTNVASSFGNVILTKERWWAGSLYGQNDPSASLFAQAKAIAQDKFGNTSLDYQKGSFIRWNDITVTTMVPTSWIPGNHRVRDLTLSVGVQNLGILWSKFTGMDPQVSDPASTGSSLQQRQVGDVRMSGDNAVPLPRVWQFRFNLNI
jgi:hypothetical protein